MLSLSSCCSVGSRQSGATLTNEASFRNGSNPFKTQWLDPAALHSSLQPPAQADHWYQQHCWPTCLLPLGHLYILQLHYVTDAAQSCPLALLHVTMAGAARDSARHSWQLRVSPALSTALPRFSHCTPAHKHGCIFNIPEAIFASSPFMAFLEYSLYSVVCTKRCTWKVDSPLCKFGVLFLPREKCMASLLNVTYRF